MGKDEQQETEIGYKIVSLREGEQLWSYTSWVSYPVRYGKFWTRPPIGCGPLSVFKTKAAVEFFLVFEGATPEPDVHSFKCLYVKSAEDSIWRLDGPFKLRSRRELFPIGTVLADAVKLLEKVG